MPSRNVLSTSTTPYSVSDVSTTVARTAPAKVAWVAHLFGNPPRPEAPLGEFQDVSDFFRAFGSNKPGWDDLAKSARQALAQSTIAEARLSALARARLAKGLSQSQLAQLIGTSQSHIARIEAHSIDPQLGTMEKIATALDIPIDQLVVRFIDERP